MLKLNKQIKVGYILKYKVIKKKVKSFGLTIKTNKTNK